MGYLNNSTVTVDAILTTKGRQSLAQGSALGLNIRYFALGDDEVNYDLWNPAHPLGSDYYGIIIENMPVLEASPIPEQNLKSKLITLNRDTTSLKTIISSPASIGTSNAPLLYDIDGKIGNNTPTQATLTFSLSSGGSGNNNTLGYTVTYDQRYFTVRLPASSPAPGSEVASTINLNVVSTSAIGDSSSSSLVSAVVPPGFNSIVIEFKNSSFIPNGNSVQNIFIQGNEVGGTVTIPVYFRRGNVSGGGSL
jgi:hypothetical protein